MKNLFLVFLCLITINFQTIAKITNPSKMVTLILLLEGDDDTKTITTIYTTLMAVEKVSKVLNIEITSETFVEDGIFVFALKSEEQKELTLKMFDEEGYELAAHRIMKIEEGNSYRAINVESLEDGTYILQLSDTEGADVSKTIKIANKKQ